MVAVAAVSSADTIVFLIDPAHISAAGATRPFSVLDPLVIVSASSIFSILAKPFGQMWHSPGRMLLSVVTLCMASALTLASDAFALGLGTIVSVDFLNAILTQVSPYIPANARPGSPSDIVEIFSNLVRVLPVAVSTITAARCVLREDPPLGSIEPVGAGSLVSMGTMASFQHFLLANSFAGVPSTFASRIVPSPELQLLQQELFIGLVPLSSAYLTGQLSPVVLSLTSKAFMNWNMPPQVPDVPFGLSEYYQLKDLATQLRAGSVQTWISILQYTLRNPELAPVMAFLQGSKIHVWEQALTALVSILLPTQLHGKAFDVNLLSTLRDKLVKVQYAYDKITFPDGSTGDDAVLLRVQSIRDELQRGQDMRSGAGNRSEASGSEHGVSVAQPSMQLSIVLNAALYVLDHISSLPKNEAGQINIVKSVTRAQNVALINAALHTPTASVLAAYPALALIRPAALAHTGHVVALEHMKSQAVSGSSSAAVELSSSSALNALTQGLPSVKFLDILGGTFPSETEWLKYYSLYRDLTSLGHFQAPGLDYVYSNISVCESFVQFIVTTFASIMLDTSELLSICAAAKDLAASLSPEHAATALKVVLRQCIQRSLSAYSTVLQTHVKIMVLGSQPKLIAFLEPIIEARQHVLKVLQSDLSWWGLPSPLLGFQFGQAAASYSQSSATSSSQGPMQLLPVLLSPHGDSAGEKVPTARSPEVTVQVGSKHPREVSGSRGERDAFGSIPGVDPPADQGKKSFCYDFLRGDCRWSPCDFNHYTQEELAAIQCKQFLSGTCRRGDQCIYRHA